MIIKLFLEMFTAKPVEHKADELFPGVQKPSSILVGIICQQMLMDLNIQGGKFSSYSRLHREYSYSYKSVKVSIQVTEWDSPRLEDDYTFFLKNHDKKIKLDSSEQALLKSTFINVRKILQDKKIAEAEHARQLASLDAIEEIMGINKEKTLTYVNNTGYLYIKNNVINMPKHYTIGV